MSADESDILLVYNLDFLLKKVLHRETILRQVVLSRIFLSAIQGFSGHTTMISSRVKYLRAYIRVNIM